MDTNPINKKRRLGLYYGFAAGFAFAGLAWGVDAWMLSQAHVEYSWIKILPGAILSVLCCGLAGWLTMRFASHLAGMFFWSVAAFILSWLVAWLPLDGTASFLEIINPYIYNLTDFADADNLSQIRLFSLIVIGFAAIISSLLEIPFIDQALFSAYGFTAVIAVLPPLILFAIAGNSTDHLINVHFRDPILALDDLIQFAHENEGKEVSKQVARKIHLSTVTPLGDMVQRDRNLTLIGYDGTLGQIDVLVDFDGELAKCTVIYSQPTFCRPFPDAR